MINLTILELTSFVARSLITLSELLSKRETDWGECLPEVRFVIEMFSDLAPDDLRLIVDNFDNELRKFEENYKI